MLQLLLLPGDLLCDWARLEREGANRQVLRSFFNMMIWGAIMIGLAIALAP